MGHEITAQAVREARDDADVPIASSSSGRGNKRMIWNGRAGEFRIYVNGAFLASAAGAELAAEEYNRHDF